jgi:ankyrin repeat protein
LPDSSGRCIEFLEGPVLQARLARSPAVHASVLALAATSKNTLLREYAVDRLRAYPSLVHERYNGWRNLLHGASGSGDVKLVEQLLDRGAGVNADDDRAVSPLYGVGNECSAPGPGQIVRILLQRSSARVNAVHGVKRCTALHTAARRGNVDVIGALLDGGAYIEARDSAGDTPLRRRRTQSAKEASVWRSGRCVRRIMINQARLRAASTRLDGQ